MINFIIETEENDNNNKNPSAGICEILYLPDIFSFTNTLRDL